MNIVNAEAKFDVPTMSQGRKWRWRTNKITAIGLPVIGSAFVAFGLYCVIHLSLFTGSVFLLFVFGIYLILKHWIYAWQFSRALRKHPQYNDTLKWTFSNEGFQVDSEHGSAKGTWNLFIKTFTTPDGFLLIPQNSTFNWIPRNGFSSVEAAAQFEDILKRHTPNKTEQGAAANR